MREIYEFRIRNDYAHLLFKKGEGHNYGLSVRVIQIEKNDIRFGLIGDIQKKLLAEGAYFFSSWKIIRYYTNSEIDNAKLFCVRIKRAFEPAGEECGTIYDESTSCEICKANARQIGPLKLKKGSIPKTDISRSIADEVVVSAKLVEIFKQRNLKGSIFAPVLFGKGTTTHYQLGSSSIVKVTSKTITGGDPFDCSNADSPGGEFYIQGYKIVHPPQVFKCPLGHTIGAHLLSEVHILDSPSLCENDFFASEQKIGARQGLLRQHPIYLCSPAFRKMVIDESLTGFDFEVAYIDSKM